MQITLNEKQAAAVLEAVELAETLASDLVAIERAGLDTGFKKGVPAQYERTALAALKIMEGAS